MSIVTKGNYNIKAVYFNTMKRDGTPAKRPWWSVLLSDGGKFPSWDYQAVSHLIGQQETQRLYDPPVLAELLIEARGEKEGGPRVVRQPQPVAVPAMVAPGQPAVQPAPVTSAPRPAQVAGGQTIRYNPSFFLELGDDPLKGPDVVRGQPGGAVQQDNIKPATEVKPPVKTGDTPPPASDLKEREFAFRQATEILKARQIPRMSAWNRVIDVLNTSASNLDERLARIRDGKLTPLVNLIYSDILSAGEPTEQPDDVGEIDPAEAES